MKKTRRKKKTMFSIKWMFKSGKRTAAVSSVFVLTLLSIIIFSAGRSYSLNPAVTHSFYTIPGNAVNYVEILNPQKFYSVLENSKFGRSFIDSQAWQKLSGTPEFQKLSNLLYFIELKAGNVIDYKDIPSFFGGSAGFAQFEDGSFLVVAKTNMKSRLGLSLMTAFKGKTVQVPVKRDVPADGRKLEGVSDSSYSDLFDEQKVQFSNLEATRINVQNGYLFIVMADDYVFISDKENVLKESLSVATTPSSSELKNAKGMSDALSAYEAKGQLLVYTDSKKSLLAPLLVQFGDSKGMALVLYADPDKNIEGDIFQIGKESAEKQIPEKGTAWEKIIPADAALTVYSSNININDSAKALVSLGGSWKDNVDDFFKDAEMDRASYFGNQKGVSFTLHGADLFNKKLYPQFSIGYSSEKKDNALYSSIFKTDGEEKQSFLGIGYNSLKNTKGHYYIPSWYYGKAGIISSSRLNLEKYISAGKGNSPVLADDSSYKLLGEYAQAPDHVVVNIDKAVEAFRQFYLYGGERTGGFTKITVDRDIMPLADPLKAFETLHIAIGLNKTPSGKLVITDAKKN